MNLTAKELKIVYYVLQIDNGNARTYSLPDLSIALELWDKLQGLLVAKEDDIDNKDFVDSKVKLSNDEKALITKLVGEPQRPISDGIHVRSLLSKLKIS